MGVSSVGFRGIRPSSVPYLLVFAVAVLALVYYLIGPPLTPAFRDAANRDCNVLVNGDYRSYTLTWRLPSPRQWWAHWDCSDARDPGKEAVDLGWWVNPFD